jgi:hypothetical protein
MSAAGPTVDPRELFLQPGPGRKPGEFQLFLWTPAPQEFHFYLAGLGPAEFGRVFERELKAAQCLVLSYDPALLAPEFWEPSSREAEEKLRTELGGIVVRVHEGTRQLWRADRATAAGRLLAEDPGTALGLVHGRTLLAPGAFLARIAEPPGLQEWAAFKALGADVEAVSGPLQADLEHFRLQATRPTVLFSTDAARATRVIFRSPDHRRTAVNAALRGFLVSLCDDHVAPISRRVIDMLCDVADGLGLRCAPETDFTDKGRTFELSAHLGRTLWGVRRPEAMEDLGDDTRILIYYDRVSGIWQVVS